jgi:hypothetical protein
MQVDDTPRIDFGQGETAVSVVVPRTGGVPPPRKTPMQRTCHDFAGLS